jgi:hypothetical protein
MDWKLETFQWHFSNIGNKLFAGFHSLGLERFVPRDPLVADSEFLLTNWAGARVSHLRLPYTHSVNKKSGDQNGDL